MYRASLALDDIATVAFRVVMIKGMMASELTITKKNSICVIAFLVCLTLLSATSLKVISVLSDSLDLAVNGTAKKLDLVGGTREAFRELKGVSQRVQLS
jgi:hypothetical protein